ncbi:MAG: DUF4173 domain-containing protein, partial [Actinomycetota bacterium]|nr:DUF4173 domain-containing protein [Actinomycetota bacterium]
FTAAALALLAMAAVYDARWVIAVDLAAAAVCATLALAGARTWVTVFAAPVCAVGDAFRVPAEVVRSIPRGKSVPWLAPAGRAAAASLLLLMTFGALFASADAAFAHIAAQVLVPDLGLDLLPARIFVVLAVAAGAGALILVAQRAAVDPTDDEPRWRPATTLEWTTPLLALDVLFAAFVAVQVAVLFGGHDHVLDTAGLTYAQYARAGFFQLVWIAALVLGVIALVVKVTPPERERLRNLLLGVLCALTLVVLASALRRMNLYEEVYGLTRIRISVYAVVLWLAAIFAAVMLAGLFRRGAWLPRAVIGLSVAGLLAFNLANPDARIARSAVERFERTGEIDAYYLSTLSTDALPALMELPVDARGCTAARIAWRTERGPWSSFNLSRHRAAGLAAPEDMRCSY